MLETNAIVCGETTSRPIPHSHMTRLAEPFFYRDGTATALLRTTCLPRIAITRRIRGGLHQSAELRQGLIAKLLLGRAMLDELIEPATSMARSGQPRWRNRPNHVFYGHLLIHRRIHHCLLMLQLRVDKSGG